MESITNNSKPIAQLFGLIESGGGKFYFVLRSAIDTTLMLLWVLWSGMRVKNIFHQLCPVSWKPSHCASEAQKEGMKQVVQFIALVPLVFAYVILFLVLHRRSSASGENEGYDGFDGTSGSTNARKKPISIVQTWCIIILVLHLFGCVLWCMYSSALGIYGFIAFVVLFGLIVDLVLCVRFFMLRRAQKKKEDESGQFSVQHDGLINEF